MTGIKLDLALMHYAITGKKYLVELVAQIKTEYLDERCKAFYETSKQLFLDPRINDVLSFELIKDHLVKTGREAELLNYERVYRAAEATEIKPGDFRYYLKLLKERQNRRILERSNRQTLQLLEDGGTLEQLNAIHRRAELEIKVLNSGQVYDQGTLGSDAKNMYFEYQQIKEDPYGMRGVYVGYPTWDSMSNGLQRSELYVIAGLEGSGKSALMMNWAVNAWLGTNKIWTPEAEIEPGHNVLYFTLEMPRSNRGELTQAAYLNKRMACCLAEVDFNRLRSGKLTEEEEFEFKRAVDFMAWYDKYYKLYVVDIPRGATLQDIEAKYLEVVEEIGKVHLVVVDYLGLMCAEGDDWEQQGKLAAGLHEQAREYKIPILTAVQMNRPQGNKGSLAGQHYNTTRIARSAQISQNANVVLMIETGDEELVNEMVVHIVKFRDGKKGTLRYVKALDKMRLYESAGLVPTEQAVSTFEAY